jgi:hypothetical protein
VTAPDAPSAAELQANPVVQAAFAAAWADSFPDDPALRHEAGGYIYFNPATGDVAVRRVPPGSEGKLDLSYPPDVRDHYLVATFHTHPTPAALGWMPDPSPEDFSLADGSGVPWFIISEEVVYVIGPDRRTGGCTGPCGYPC